MKPGLQLIADAGALDVNSVGPALARFVTQERSRWAEVVDAVAHRVAGSVHDGEVNSCLGLDGTGEEAARVVEAEVNVVCPDRGSEFLFLARPGTPAKAGRHDARVVGIGVCMPGGFQEQLCRRVPRAGAGLDIDADRQRPLRA